MAPVISTWWVRRPVLCPLVVDFLSCTAHPRPAVPRPLVVSHWQYHVALVLPGGASNMDCTLRALLPLLWWYVSWTVCCAPRARWCYVSWTVCCAFRAPWCYSSWTVCAAPAPSGGAFLMDCALRALLPLSDGACLFLAVCSAQVRPLVDCRQCALCVRHSLWWGVELSLRVRLLLPCEYPAPSSLERNLFV